MSRNPRASFPPLSATAAGLPAATAAGLPAAPGVIAPPAVRPLGWPAVAQRLGSASFYLALGATAALLATCSLLLPSTPSYDPWAWLGWGREILHLGLHTAGGPSWKPL